MRRNAWHQASAQLGRFHLPLFLLAVLGHAVAVLSDLGVAPGVLRVVACHRIAFTERLSARRAHVILGSLSEARRCRGHNGKPEEKEEELVTEADPRYFQSRPSATEGGAYNAAASTFSNRGPNSTRTEEADAENIKAYLELEGPYNPGLNAASVPVDAVNTSGSNLDPEISEANAHIQAHRVAAKRGLSLATVNGLIGKYTSGRGLGFSGEPGVNVLELNLALDRLVGGPR